MISPASDPEVRATGLGGSDIARILGLSRFGGPMEVWMEKRRLSAPLVETAPMRWGKLLEEPIAREYALQTGRRVTRWAQTIRDKKYPFLFAHVDRKAKGKDEPVRGLECKTASVFMVSDFGSPGTDEVPDDYMLQVQHYESVTGYDQFDLAVLIGGQKFAIYTIPRDDELISEMHAEAIRFWTENVEKGIPPDVDGSDAWRDYAASRFPDAGIEVEMTDEIAMLAYKYEAIKATQKDQEVQRKEVANELRVALGEASRAVGDGVKVTRSTVNMPYPDWRAIAAAAKVPDTVIAEFTRVDQQQRINVTIKPA